jgi:hypothetical protein
MLHGGSVVRQTMNRFLSLYVYYEGRLITGSSCKEKIIGRELKVQNRVSVRAKRQMSI